MKNNDRQETKLLKRNDMFSLEEFEKVEDSEDICEVCNNNEDNILYWIKEKNENCNVIMCKGCINKLKSILNYFE